MNEAERQTLIQYRLERAKETYQEAILMQSASHWNTCANRLYYACFYAVNALLVKLGYASSKHAGVRSLFNLHIVKTGLLGKKFGKLYNELFEARQEGDYVDFVEYDETLIQPWMPQVKDFIETIIQLTEE